jgi:hypothetical protein
MVRVIPPPRPFDIGRRSLTTAHLADRELTEQDLINVAAKLVPLARTMKEQINHIRSWAFERAVRASPQPTRR